MTIQSVIPATDWYVGVMTAQETQFFPLIGWLVFQESATDSPNLGGIWVDAEGEITRFTEYVGRPCTLTYWHASQMTDEMMESAFSRGGTLERPED